MQKKILIAVDGSPASRHAVDYAALMQQGSIPDLSVVLFFVMNPIPPFLRREGSKNPQMFRQLQAMERKNRQAAHQALHISEERLWRAGMPEEQIEIKATPRTSDVARDILFEAEQGLYDALLMGKRGTSRAKQVFSGSVTNTVVQHAERIPVWVVDGKVKSPNVLCAVDGSEGALRAVDHMAFVLGADPQVRITLFHIGASLANYCELSFNEDIREEIEGDLMRDAQECMDNFYTRAIRVLNQGGIEESQVKTVVKEGGISVPKAILSEAAKGGYGTVVLGRRGENRSFFLGHVSDKVLGGGEHMAVWVVG